MDLAIRSGVSRVALMAGEFSPRSICSIEGEGEGEGGGGGDGGAAGAGGAAALLGKEGDGDGEGGDKKEGEGEGGGDADAAFLEQFSAEGGDADNPSPRDWIKSKGIKSLDDLAKNYREAEKSIRNGGKLTVPGEGAKPEEIAAYHKAIGVPDTPEGYEFTQPEGAELDGDLVTPLREVALKAGVPAAGFKALAEGLIQVQLDQLEGLKTAEDADAAKWQADQGAQKAEKMASVNNAMRALGLKPADVAAMQRGFSLQGQPGSAKVLGLLATIGGGIAEDALLGGDGKRRFGITGAEAKTEVDRLVVDRDFQAKLTAKDPAAVERWNRLNGAIAAARDQENAKAAAA